jgi:asparagine synthase (glutamine-hydrolysing)
VDGKIVVSFNGEIYNYWELRSALEKEGCIFQTQSDTEVLLHLYRKKGEKMVGDLRGMFAFVIWDEERKKMVLARDPYGIKPLYYADDGWSVRVASEVKALLTSPKVSKTKNPAGIVGFFLWGSVPEPHTLYQEIRQVPAGSIVSVDALGPSAAESYFSLAGAFDIRNPPEVLRPDVWQEQIRDAFRDSVHHHLVSDVPVGIFLSAGVDSALIAAMAKEVGARNLESLTLTYEEYQGRASDEAPLAAKLAAAYGLRHHVRTLSRNELNSDLERIFHCMDQPTIDGINTYFVSKAARELGWKVALSGIGGDELLGGYPSFKDLPRWVAALALPAQVPGLGSVFQAACTALDTFRPMAQPKIAGLLKYGGCYSGAYFLRRGLFMPWELKSFMPEELAHEGLRRLDFSRSLNHFLTPDPETPFGRVAILESSLYMRNQLLRDADWAGMAHSLEIRTPWVDSALVSAIAPLLCLQKNLPSKSRLVASLVSSLSNEVTARPKTGFTVPIEEWLDGEELLSDWKRIPALNRPGCHWSRKWAWMVYQRMVA